MVKDNISFEVGSKFWTLWSRDVVTGFDVHREKADNEQKVNKSIMSVE